MFTSRLRGNAIFVRLFPLYVAAFSHGFVLWYAIEKFFMRSIGFSDATIGLMVVIYTITMLLVETPSGILADRWSRRGVLMIGSLILVISTIIGGLSQSVPMYIFAMSIWGMFYALYSGTYESIVYDVVLEETGKSDAFEKWFGYVRVVDSVALTLGAALGGLLSMLLSPRAAFFITVPFSCIGIWALLRFREPVLHKKDPASSLRDHIAATFSAILKSRTLVPVLLVIVLTSLLVKTTLEFNQLWWLALAAPIVLYGPATALNLSSLGFGGFLGSKVQLSNPVVLSSVVGIILVSSASLALVRHFFVVCLAQAALVTVLVAIEVVFVRSLHDALPSRLRAGAASATSTLTSIIFIPFALTFGLVSDRSNPFAAGWLMVGGALVLGIVLVGIALRRKLYRARPEDVIAVEIYQK